MKCDLDIDEETPRLSREGDHLGKLKWIVLGKFVIVSVDE